MKKGECSKSKTTPLEFPLRVPSAELHHEIEGAGHEQMGAPLKVPQAVQGDSGAGHEQMGAALVTRKHLVNIKEEAEAWASPPHGLTKGISSPCPWPLFDLGKFRNIGGSKRLRPMTQWATVTSPWVSRVQFFPSGFLDEDGEITWLQENLAKVAWLALPRQMDRRVTLEKEVWTRRGGCGNPTGRFTSVPVLKPLQCCFWDNPRVKGKKVLKAGNPTVRRQARQHRPATPACLCTQWSEARLAWPGLLRDLSQ